MAAILTVSARLGRNGRLARVIGAADAARAPQLTMAEAVRPAERARTPLLVAVSTGTGKSLAYLAGGLAADACLVLSTSAKALQGQLRPKDLPLLARAVGGLAFAAAKGRANYLCHWKAMARLGQFSTWAWPADLPPGAMTAWAAAMATGDLNEIPFPALRPALEKVAAGDDCCGPHCQFYGAARSADVTRRALRWAAELAPDLAALGDEFTHAVAGRYGEAHHDRVIPVEDVIIEGADLVAARRDLASDYWSGSLPPTDPVDAERYAHAVRLHNVALQVQDVADPIQPGYVRHVAYLPERRGAVTDAIVIANTACQVSDLLAQLPERTASGVYCAATLATGLGPASLGFFKRSVGRARAGVTPAERIVGAPFDYSRQGLLSLPPPGRLPADPNAPECARASARALAALVRRAGGRARCLFTAYIALRQAAAFGQLAPEITVLPQGEDLSRDTILTQFRAARGRGLVIRGTTSFWEGVSLEGTQLTPVAVDRVPFTPPGPVQLAKPADLAARGGQPAQATPSGPGWFRELALPEATLAPALAPERRAGASVRTTPDRGVGARLEPRLTTRPWGQTSLNALPPFRGTADLAQVAHFLAAAMRTAS